MPHPPRMLINLFCPFHWRLIEPHLYDNNHTLDRYYLSWSSPSNSQAPHSCYGPTCVLFVQRGRAVSAPRLPRHSPWPQQQARALRSSDGRSRQPDVEGCCQTCQERKGTDYKLGMLNRRDQWDGVIARGQDCVLFPGEEVLPYISHIVTFHSSGYHFQGIISSVSNRVQNFTFFCLKQGHHHKSPFLTSQPHNFC